ncbi:MAG TPA: SDR family NAD(P)-dependent oxidoreductase [Planctomycetota bacterium]|nr:SDR family NAD(P)-dependent oxidoreductase [Planctomycetota bacterium]
MTKRFYLVTGGTGFLGSALVRRLIKDGHRVRVIDDNSRGNNERLADVAGQYEFVQGDIRDAAAVERACDGVDSVCHLAYVNGTEYFYTKPDLVLEVGVVGMINVLNGCRKHGVKELMLTSTSEVYQTPPKVPTDETVPLSIPDVLNPRYSYGGGKIISELLAINYGRVYFDRVLIVRPHNVYGANMGWEHVIPQFVLRMHDLCAAHPSGPINFPIQGTGEETRSFVHVDDFTDGLVLVLEKGQHLNIYHIGTLEEISIANVAREVGRCFKREVNIVPGPLLPGGTPRRCPDIAKLARLGYKPKLSLREGLQSVARWYDENAHQRPEKERVVVPVKIAVPAVAKS